MRSAHYLGNFLNNHILIENKYRVKLNKTNKNILPAIAIIIAAYFLYVAIFDSFNVGAYGGLIGLFAFVIQHVSIKLGWIDPPPARLSKEYVDDPLTKMSFTDSTLVLGGYEIHKSKIKRVVLDSVKAIDGNTKQGLVQLPFNQQKGAIPELWFNPQHLQNLKDYIQIHIPNVMFIK